MSVSGGPCGFRTSVVKADNVNFSGKPGVPGGQVTTDGQLMIGATAFPNIRVGSLTSTGGTITVTNGPGTINLDLAGGSVGVDSIAVQAVTAPGVSPVVPTGAGLMTVNGATVAAQTIPVQSRSIALNSYQIEVQRASSSVATNATQQGLSSFNSAQFTVDANGFVSSIGAGASTFPVDVGGPGVPLAGSLSLLGSASTDFPNNSGIQTHVGATTNEIYIEDRRFLSPIVVDTSTTVGLQGEFSTLASAIAAASGGADPVLIRTDTYVESLVFTGNTGMTGISLSADFGGPTIIGNHTIPSGSYDFTGLTFVDAGAGPMFTLTGGLGTSIAFRECLFVVTAAQMISFAGAAGAVDVSFYDCQFSVSALGRLSSNITTGHSIYMKGCQVTNTGAGLWLDLNLTATAEIRDCDFNFSGTVTAFSSGGSSIIIDGCDITSGGAPINFNSAGVATCTITHTKLTCTGKSVV